MTDPLEPVGVGDTRSQRNYRLRTYCSYLPDTGTFVPDTLHTLPHPLPGLDPTSPPCRPDPKGEDVTRGRPGTHVPHLCRRFGVPVTSDVISSSLPRNGVVVDLLTSNRGSPVD